jgi:hypothetical protein
VRRVLRNPQIWILSCDGGHRRVSAVLVWFGVLNGSGGIVDIGGIVSYFIFVFEVLNDLCHHFLFDLVLQFCPLLFVRSFRLK